MFIDCDGCPVRGTACSGCLLTALFDAPPHVGQLTVEEHRAIEVLTRAGFEVEVLAPPFAPVSDPAPVSERAPVPLAPRRRARPHRWAA